VGAAAHSFGLETLCEDCDLQPDNLEPFLHAFLLESGVLEASFVYRAAEGCDVKSLSAEFEARRPARESREASVRIGRRFAGLFNAMVGTDIVADTLPYAVAFGTAGRHLTIPGTEMATAYLQQSVSGAISVFQRLLPFGQIAASRLLWSLRDDIRAAVARAKTSDVSCFTPLLELGSMRHGSLETRLFIS